NCHPKCAIARRIYAPGGSMDAAGEGPQLALQALLPLLQLHARADRLPIAHHLHVHYISDLAPPQRIGEIVEIIDRLIPKLDEHITGLEASLCCRRSRLNV